MRELRRRWRTAEHRVADATPWSPEWDAALAESAELEARYMHRLERILEREARRAGRGDDPAVPGTLPARRQQC